MQAIKDKVQQRKAERAKQVRHSVLTVWDPNSGWGVLHVCVDFGGYMSQRCGGVRCR
jgi:hypothetical protein